MIESLYEKFRPWSSRGSVYLTADTHFDDADRSYMGYLMSSEEQAEVLRRRCHRGDTLIILGDVGDPKYLEAIRSTKILIAGNHDIVDRYVDHFDEVYSGPLWIGPKLLLSHEPVQISIFGSDEPIALNIHGHDHAGTLIDDAHINLAVNVFGAEPLNLKSLIKSGILSRIDSIHRQTIDRATLKKQERNLS